MRTELRAVPHAIVPNTVVFEVWHNGKFIATVTGADGPGVRIVSKHRITAMLEHGTTQPEVSISTSGEVVNVVTVMVYP